MTTSPTVTISFPRCTHTALLQFPSRHIIPSAGRTSRLTRLKTGNINPSHNTLAPSDASSSLGTSQTHTPVAAAHGIMIATVL